MSQQAFLSYDDDLYSYRSLKDELDEIFDQFDDKHQLLEYQKRLKKHADDVKPFPRGVERFEAVKMLCRDYIYQNGGRLIEEISPELCAARLTLISTCLPILPQNAAWLIHVGTLCKNGKFCAYEEKKIALQLDIDYFYPHEQPAILAMDEWMCAKTEA